jgi:hypothetical protein
MNPGFRMFESISEGAKTWLSALNRCTHQHTPNDTNAHCPFNIPLPAPLCEAILHRLVTVANQTHENKQALDIRMGSRSRSFAKRQRHGNQLVGDDSCYYDLVCTTRDLFQLPLHCPVLISAMVPAGFLSGVHATPIKVVLGKILSAGMILAFSASITQRCISGILTVHASRIYLNSQFYIIHISCCFGGRGSSGISCCLASRVVRRRTYTNKRNRQSGWINNGRV